MQYSSRRVFLLAAIGVAVCVFDPAAARHPVPDEHPRLLGSQAELKSLAETRADAYRRVVGVARSGRGDDHARMLSLGLVYAIEGDADLGEQAKQLAMKYVRGPIVRGHATFGHDLARCALVYDLCFPCWTEDERKAFHDYLNRTVDANVQSETHVFHNGWYGYKNWGIGLAGYATYHENSRAPEILKTLEDDYRLRAAPALKAAGAGGGFAEGYYIHYWLYEWLFFCDVARRCEGVDYLQAAPEFYGQRAVASMFEMYPGLSDYGSRRPVPMGDGGGRQFGGDRDKALSARRILVHFHRDDPLHQAVHAFNETTPRSAVGDFAYKDFLWRDPSVPRGELARAPLSHYSAGPGYFYARSSWEEDATYFFFKCGDRFTAHQHLDVNHFLVFKHAELAGDGGHYDGFGSRHDVNYHLRSIAHNTLLVYDPDESWSGIRGVASNANDGGQTHAWRHHNGAFADVADWKRQYSSAHVGQILAFADETDYVYVAGDGSRAYSPHKLDCFTRQIVFLRPDTFVIFDRVRSTNPAFRKTWLLQALKTPVEQSPHLVITNGPGRLFVQTLLPEAADVRLVSGEDLYRYGGQSFPPERNTGPAPECRIEVSPATPAETDYFLHVLTAADAQTQSVPVAKVDVGDQGPNGPSDEVLVTLSGREIRFSKSTVGGHIVLAGQPRTFPTTLQPRPTNHQPPTTNN